MLFKAVWTWIASRLRSSEPYVEHRRGALTIRLFGNVRYTHAPIDEWFDGLIALIFAFDGVLLEHNLAPLSTKMDGFVLELRHDHAAPAEGIWYVERKTVVLYLRSLGTHWYEAKLEHELGHAWEGLVLGLSYAEWKHLDDNGQHFAMGNLARTLQQEALARAKAKLARPPVLV